MHFQVVFLIFVVVSCVCKKVVCFSSPGKSFFCFCVVTRLENSSSLKKSLAFAHSDLSKIISLKVTGTLTCLSVNNLRLKKAFSFESSSKFLVRSFFTSSIFLYRLSRESNSVTSSVAPFFPMPLTPGMLSDASPTIAWKKESFSGSKPCLLKKTFSSMISFFMGSRIMTLSPTSWWRSLSGPTMTKLFFGWSWIIE